MAQERILVDISSEPALRQLVDQVRAVGVPAILQIDRQDVAILSPTVRSRKRRRGVLAADDPLLRLVGAFESNIPGGVSADKHEALLQAKRNH